jgi:hypothetical protein
MGKCIVSISNKIRYTVYLYLETALHVSGVTSTHHQERIQLCLQHLVFVTPLLLSAAIVHESVKVVTLTHRPSLPPGISWYSFLEAESTPGHMELSDASEKIPSAWGSVPGPSDQ